MKVFYPLVCFLLLCSFSSAFAADPVTAGGADKKTAKSTSPAPSQKSATTPSENCNAACREYVAETLFRSAMDFAANDLKVIARRYVGNLLKLYPKTKAAAKARVWIKTPGLFLDQSGRLEFIVTTSLFSIGAGVIVPLALQANDAFIFGISILAFGSAGIVGSIFGSANIEMTSGQASLISSGLLLGTWNMGALLGILGFGANVNITQAMGFGLPLLGAALGYTGGFILGRVTKVTSGRVTMATSTATFLGIYTGLIMAMARVPVFGEGGAAGWVSLLLSSDLGYVAGWLLHTRLKFSRTRTLLMSLGGVLGAAAGGAVVALTTSLYTDDRPVWGILLGFSLAGIVLAGVLTRHYKPEDESNPFSKSLASNGALFAFRGKRWGFGMPIPALMPQIQEGGKIGWSVLMPVVNGRW